MLCSEYEYLHHRPTINFYGSLKRPNTVHNYKAYKFSRKSSYGVCECRNRRWNGNAILGVLCSIIIALLVATLVRLVYWNPVVTAKECNCKQQPQQPQQQRTVYLPCDSKPPQSVYVCIISSLRNIYDIMQFRTIM